MGTLRGNGGRLVYLPRGDAGFDDQAQVEGHRGVGSPMGWSAHVCGVARVCGTSLD